MPGSTALNGLGISNLQEIMKIKVEHTEAADILTVYYGRSLFGFSRSKKKITFNRSSRQILINKQGRNEWKHFSCPSPQFQLALDELHSASNKLL